MKKQKELPTIKILSIKEVTSDEVQIQASDATFKMIERHGRKHATAEDFVRIGFIRMLEDTIKDLKKHPKK